MRRAELANLPTPPPWSVPNLYKGEAFLCVGCGPSLTQEQLQEALRIRRDYGLFTIAIKESYRLAPWADVLYAAADKEWGRVKGAPDFKGLRVSIDVLAAQRYPGILWLEWERRVPGLSLDPTRLRGGEPWPHSGFQALNLAVLLGAKRIVLLGYDMRSSPTGNLHWFPDAERVAQPKIPFAEALAAYEPLPAALAELGVEVTNCTPGSALRCFPMKDLREAWS